MNLKELINKIEKYNKLGEELNMTSTYYLVVMCNYSKSVFLYKKRDIKNIEDYYIKEIAEKLINGELKQEERYLYSIEIESPYGGKNLYTIAIGEY